MRKPKQHIGSRADVLIGKYGIKERIIGTSVDEKRKMRGQQERIMGTYADKPRVPLDQPKLIIGQHADEQLTLMSGQVDDVLGEEGGQRKRCASINAEELRDTRCQLKRLTATSDDELFESGQEDLSQHQHDRQTSEDDELGEGLEIAYQEEASRRAMPCNQQVAGSGINHDEDEPHEVIDEGGPDEEGGMLLLETINVTSAISHGAIMWPRKAHIQLLQ